MTSVETLYPNRAAFSSCGWAFLQGDFRADLCACPTSNLKNTAHSSAAADSLASVSPVLSSESTGGPVWPGNWCAVPPDLGPQMMSCAGLWASLAVFPTPQQYPTLLLSTGPCSNHPGSLITESRQHRESFYKIVYVSHMLDTKESL